MEVQQQQTPPPSDMLGMKEEPLSPTTTPQTGLSGSGSGLNSPRKAGGPGRPLTADRKRPYPCNLCPSRFGSKMELEEHQNSHTGQKPFECDVCKARFNRRSTLWNHKRIHSDAKPFVCPVCEMTFKWKNSLKCHKEMHLRKNESGGLDLEQLRQLTYASAAKRKSGEGVQSSSSSKKRKPASQTQQLLQSPMKSEANGQHAEQEQEQKHQQLPAMHLQSVPVLCGNGHGSSLLQQALQSALISDNNAQSSNHHSHSNVVSSHPVCSMPTEPPPDPAPNHYVTSHHLTLPIMSAESKADNMMSFSHSQTTAVLHAPHLPPQFLNVRLVNPMPVVEQLMGSLTPPTAPHNPPSHQQQQQQQQHLLLQQQTYNSPPQGTTGTGGPAHLLRSPNPPQPVSYHQQQQQHHVLDQPVAAATADYVPNFDYLLPSQVNNTYQQQESQPLPMNHGGVATAVATAASPGYLVKIVPYDQW